MIQLKEDDFLWRMYKRFYAGQREIPHPRTVCNFFWKAMRGMCLKLIWDTNILCPVLLFGSILAFSILGSYYSESDSVLNVLTFFTSLISGSAFVIVTCGRFLWWAERNEKQWVPVVVMAVVVLVFLSFGLGSKYARDYEISLISGAILGGLTLLALLTLLVGFILVMYWLNNDTNTCKVLKSNLIAFKTKICPLIKVPGEEDVKFKSERNSNKI